MCMYLFVNMWEIEKLLIHVSLPYKYMYLQIKLNRHLNSFNDS